MATAPQEPARQSISFVRGDAWGLEIDFAEYAGQTVTAGLYSTVTGALVQPITVTVLDALAGRVNLSLTATQTAGIAAGTYDFRVAWSPSERRLYEGFAEVLP